MFRRAFSLVARLLILPIVAFAPFVGQPALASETVTSALPMYQVTDLGTLGGTWSFANSINDRGQIAGSATLPGDSATHGFLWQNGQLTDLGTLGGNDSYAVSIDESGVVTGGAETTNPSDDYFCGAPNGPFPGVCHAFSWRNGVMTDLGSPLGGLNTGANTIDDRGQVAGQAEIAATDPNFGFTEAHAAVWQRGITRDLGVIGGPTSWIQGSNDRGQFTGGSTLNFNIDPTTGYYDIHAVVFDSGSIQDLGTLGGSVSSGFSTNDLGQVAGFSGLANSSEDHAFLWSHGTMQDLGTVSGDTGSGAFFVSDRGEVLGLSGSNLLTTGLHAFLWQNGVMTDLNTRISANSGWQLQQAFGMNARGQIVGQGVINGQYHGFLLTPVSTGDVSFGSGSSVTAAASVQTPPLPESERRWLAWLQSRLGQLRAR
jgi:probable HAF family extracellular repeat protein